MGGRVARRPLRLRSGGRWGRGRPHSVECSPERGATVNRRPEAGGGEMASASGSSDLAGSGAPPPGGGAQAAAAEEEEREVVRVRVKVRLTADPPARLGCPQEGKAVTALGWRAGPEIWGVT